MEKIRIKKVLPLLNSPVPSLQNRTGWIISPCPLAPYTHAKGIDKNPSFGVKISDIGISRFNCFSCGHFGDLNDLVLELRFLGANKEQGYDLGGALQLIAKEEEDAELNIPDYEDESEELLGNAKVIPWPEEWLNSFVPFYNFPKAVDYMKSRGIPLKWGKKFDLRFDTFRQRVCFPVRDWNKAFVGLHGRDITGHAPYPYHAYKYNDHWNKLPWCGEHESDPDDLVILCESVFDYAKIKMVYPNTLCSLSAGLGPQKCKRVDGFPEIVTFYDYGTGGDTARATIEKYLGHIPIVHVIPEPDQKDPGNMSPAEITSALDNLI